MKERFMGIYISPFLEEHPHRTKLLEEVLVI